MSALLERLNGFGLFLLVPILGGLLVGLIGIIASAWVRLREAEIAADLKRDMLNRGMSPEEISIVMEAGIHRRKPAAVPAPQGASGRSANE